MAWTCKSCNTEVASDTDLACPSCGKEKQVWTMHGGQTRQFSVTTRVKKLEFRRGVDSGPGGEGATYQGVETVVAEKAVAVPKGLAQSWHDQGQLPPPDQVLFARLRPGDNPDLTTHFTAIFEAAEPVETEHPAPAGAGPDAEGVYDARFLCVYGPEALDPELSFAGLAVIDVSEENEVGYAPQVGLRALGRKRKDLPLDAQGGGVFRLACAKIRFNTDSAIFMPGGLAVLRAALEHVKEHSDHQLLIASHTDAQGSDESNLDLSRARSQNVLHMLMGEAKPWAEACDARDNSHKHQDVRQVLKWAAEVWNWSCDPGAVDNSAPPEEAIKAFKDRFAHKFSSNYTPTDQDPAVDVGFWRRVMVLYGWVLMDQLQLQDRRQIGELCGKIQWVDPEVRAIGCGEKFLKVATQKAEEENRRTEFLFFAPDEAPAPSGDESALHAVYSGSYEFEDLECPDPTFFGNPLPKGNVVFVIDASGSMSPSDRAGQQARPDRIGFAKRNLAQAIRDLDEAAHFSVIAYNDSVFYPFREQNSRQVWQPRFEPATSENKSAAIQWVNRLRAQNRTATSQALLHAFNVLSPGEGETKVVLLTDGAPTPRNGGRDARVEMNRIVEEVAGYSADWRLDTIGFYQEGQNPGQLETFLQDLASGRGGTYTPVYVQQRAAAGRR